MQAVTKLIQQSTLTTKKKKKKRKNVIEFCDSNE